MKLELYAVRIFCFDWERAVDFYRVTLGLPQSFANGELGWAEFEVGGSHLAIERVDPWDDDALALVGRFVGVSLQVEDMDRAYAMLSQRGVEFASAPEKQRWGGTLAHFKDPDGNVLTLLG